MTRKEYLALQPGDIIRAKYGKRLPRLVIDSPKLTHRGAINGLGLAKIGHSWTDPNPTAWYDAWYILRNYDVTGRRGCSRAYALKLRQFTPKLSRRRFWKKP